MKNNLKKYLSVSLMLLFLAVNLVGCNQTSEKKSITPPANQSQETKSADNLKSFSKADLSKYNGRNGTPAYVAVDGKIYDVTNDRAWKNGQHEAYQAGTDLTADMKNSPHGSRVLEGLPVVGKLTD